MPTFVTRTAAPPTTVADLLPKPALVAIGPLDPALFAGLAARVGWPVAWDIVDPAPALDPRRNQYDSTLLLTRLPQGHLAVTSLDLCIPILEFVFGEAALAGLRAVVSLHRLRDEFYGLPPSHELLLDRLAKECRHEWGHALGLHHCPRYDCAMHATHSIELLDLKNEHYCPACLATLDSLYHRRPVPGR